MRLVVAEVLFGIKFKKLRLLNDMTLTKEEKKMLREWVDRGDVRYLLEAGRGLPEEIVELILDILKSKI